MVCRVWPLWALESMPLHAKVKQESRPRKLGAKSKRLPSNPKRPSDEVAESEAEDEARDDMQNHIAVAKDEAKDEANDDANSAKADSAKDDADETKDDADEAKDESQDEAKGDDFVTPQKPSKKGTTRAGSAEEMMGLLYGKKDALAAEADAMTADAAKDDFADVVDPVVIVA